MSVIIMSAAATSGPKIESFSANLWFIIMIVTVIPFFLLIESFPDRVKYIVIGYIAFAIALMIVLISTFGL